MMFNIKNKFILLLALMFLTSFSVYAEETEEDRRRYRTLEERRDAGIKHQLTEWLEVSPLFELEYSKQRLIPLDVLDSETSISETHKTLQLEIIVDPAEWVNFEIVYEYDDLLDELILDEAVAEFIAGDFKLEVGRFTVPFGEYYSRFVTGPLLELGETDARSLVFAWEPDDEFEAAVFILKSRVEKTGKTGDSLDWGLSLNVFFTDDIVVGISYISDLSESDEKLLDDVIFYQQPVDAMSAYINIEIGNYDISLEMVQALDHFAELDVESDRPDAWNVEFGIYPDGSFEYALRIEGSNELEDEPELQAGLGATWHLHENVYVTVEYLKGKYKKDFVENDLEQVIEYQNQFASQLVISF